MNNINNEKLIRIEQNKKNPIYKKKYVYSPTPEDILKYGLLLPSVNMIKRHTGIIKKIDRKVLKALLNDLLLEELLNDEV